MEQLTNTERLLLAQAVYQEGADDWSKVSQIISNHPLIGRPKSYFNPSVCSSIYASMIHVAGLEDMVKDHSKPRAEVNRKLAEVHYAARITELRDLIFQEETRFKTVLTEIEEIRSGLWDEKIKASLGIVSPEPIPEPIHHAPAAQEVAEVEEVEEAREVEEAEEVEEVKEVEGVQEAEEVEEIEEVEVEEIEEVKEVEEAKEVEEVKQVGDIEEVEGVEEVGEVGEVEEAGEAEEVGDVKEVGEAEEVEEVEEPANRTEAVPMVEPEQPGQQDDPIVIDDSDATTDEPMVAQQVTQTLEEEEVDLHLTPTSVPPSPKPTDEVNIAQEQMESTDEDPAQPVQEETEPHSPFTEQDIGEQDAEGPPDKVAAVEADQPASAPAPPEETPADDEPEPEDAQEMVASEREEPDAGVQTRRGKRKADAELEPRREKKKSREISEPLEESEPEPVPTKKRRGTTSEAASRIFQNVISLLHDQICQLRNGSIFHGPVKVSDAPDYYDIVRRPIDLKAIKTKIRDGQITNSLEYQRDIFLMFANSMMYNRPDSDLYKMAEEMMLESEQLINQFRQTEGWNQ